jgi:hypothetical protein
MPAVNPDTGSPVPRKWVPPKDRAMPKYRFRDAITGRFLKAAEALKRLATTVRERIKR